MGTDWSVPMWIVWLVWAGIVAAVIGSWLALGWLVYWIVQVMM